MSNESEDTQPLPTENVTDVVVNNDEVLKKDEEVVEMEMKTENVDVITNQQEKADEVVKRVKLDDEIEVLDTKKNEEEEEEETQSVEKKRTKLEDEEQTNQ